MSDDSGFDLAEAAHRPQRAFDSERGAARLMALHVGRDTGRLRHVQPRRCWRPPLGSSTISNMSGAAPCRSCSRLVVREARAFMAMDEATRASLEILSASGGGRKGSLIEAIDRCVTSAGARLLAEDLAAPLTDLAAIRARLELVSWLHDDPLLRGDLRAVLRAAPDIGRALGRIVAGRARRAISASCAMA
jgi:DNA mismatch repair protein MutS